MGRWSSVPCVQFVGGIFCAWVAQFFSLMLCAKFFIDGEHSEHGSLE